MFAGERERLKEVCHNVGVWVGDWGWNRRRKSAKAAGESECILQLLMEEKVKVPVDLILVVSGNRRGVRGNV